LTRPHERTIGMMDIYEGKIKSRKGYGIPPCGTVSMHIRHGDKHKEMGLFPLEMYLEKLDSLRRGKTFPSNLKVPLPIFVSTEDDEVIRKIRT